MTVSVAVLPRQARKKIVSSGEAPVASTVKVRYPKATTGSFTSVYSPTVTGALGNPDCGAVAA